MRPVIENFFEGGLLRDQVNELEKPFGEEEVKNVIFAMDGSKAPGPKGFSMHFYQECWDIIKNDLIFA